VTRRHLEGGLNLIRRALPRVAMVVLPIWLLYGFVSPVSWSDPIHLTVIDEETGRPLPGVAVAAAWWVASLNGPHALQTYKAAAVTNARGQAVVRGMPARLRPPLTWYEVDDPDLYLYAPGYRAELLTNHGLAGGYAGPYDWISARRRCYWNNRVIPLERAATPERAAEALDGMRSFTSINKLWADEFPQLWQRMAAGWDALPHHVRREMGLANPHDDIAYWRRKKR